MMNLIKKLLIAIIFSVSITDVSYAQMNQKKAKEIEAIKFGYISGKLNLNAEESQAFWPLYKSYQSEWSQLIRQKKENRQRNASNPEKTVDDDLLFDGKLLELRKNYRVAFGKVLPPEKLKALYQAERSFREELIKQLRNRSRGN